MVDSSATRIDQIESWFRMHDDGDFSVLPSDHPSSQIGNFANARTIIYTTKRHCVARIKGLSQFGEPIATIGRYGLPIRGDLPLLRGSVQSPIFIGDCDPPDLMIFSWLREHLPIVWHGVNDQFLDIHGNRDFAWIRIKMSESESEATRLLQDLCPDYRQLLGHYCSSLLDAGFKIEVEGAILDRSDGTKC
jgi:hypothetical protein